MRRSLVTVFVLSIVIAILTAAATILLRPGHNDRSSTVVTNVEPSTATVAGGSIGVYTSTELGSDASFAELEQVKAAGFDSVIAYGSMNGRTIANTRRFFDAAQADGIDVVFSVKDVLGPVDTDEDNAQHHRELFGTADDQSTDAQVATVIEQLLDHPAVKSVLISDERPEGPEDLAEWLPRLAERYGQISKVKPVSVVLYWNPDSPDFYKAVKRYADNLQIDYYPHPEHARLPVRAISDVGETLWQTAGFNGTFVLQAFGWDPENHPEGKDLGFTEKSDPPTVDEMVNDARLAVEGYGQGGATNLIFYALGEPNAASLDSITEAVTQIRAADWWKNRGN